MKTTHIFAVSVSVSAQILLVASHASPGPQHHGPSILGQTYLGGSDFIDVATGSEFFGLGTYANLPYVNCLSSNEGDEARYDIAILGAPFDTVSRMNSIKSHVILIGYKVCYW